MSIKRVLVVDDSPTERHVLQNFLTQHGFEVLMAENGEQAIVRAKTDRPDLILMDVVMPSVNGYQATRTITRDDDTRNIPVIMCTSKDLPTDRIWGMRQGALEYMIKPVDLDELLSRIRKLEDQPAA